jgi:uncharacterized membrane protein YozB (DUF420 family)
VPAGLLALSLVPAAAGALRTAELTSGARITEENARFFASPVPILLHITGATVFLVLGAFQFVPGLRRHAWHRRAGRLVVPCGVIGGLAALWMTVFYPRPPLDGDLLTVFRLVFGTYMVVALVLGFLAIRRRDVVAHRAWVTRAYAIGVAAGTQAVFYGLWEGIVGPAGVTEKALLLCAAWVFNLVVAERVIRRGKR